MKRRLAGVCTNPKPNGGVVAAVQMADDHRALAVGRVENTVAIQIAVRRRLRSWTSSGVR